MRLIKTLAVGAMSALSAACFAGPTLDFEGIGDLQDVGDFYKAAHGISFSAEAFSIVSRVAGGSGLFKNTPSPHTAVGIFGSNGNQASFVLNISGGFENAFALSFLTRGTAFGDVRIYDQLDGQGQELTASPLALNTISQTDCTDPVLGPVACEWRQVSTSFQGKAYSVRVTGTDRLLFVDDLSLDGGTTPTPVPEPGAMALVLAGFGAAFIGGRRRRQAA